MILKFWGTRGSIPVPGKDTLIYGGNTPCVEIRSGNNDLIILDAGTGIRELGNKIIRDGLNDEVIVLLSHYHWDHIQGIPFFAPLYEKKANVVFYGLSDGKMDVKSFVINQMAPNSFPITLGQVAARVKYKRLYPDKTFKIKSLSIETFRVNHSSPTLTFKIKDNNKSVVYMTDNELELDPKAFIKGSKEYNRYTKPLVDFCSGCDYLIHDAMYDESSVKSKKGWGHSSNIALALFSILAEIKNLILFHYNPEYTDDKINQILIDTVNFLKEKNSAVNCIAAKEGLEINI